MRRLNVIVKYAALSFTLVRKWYCHCLLNRDRWKKGGRTFGRMQTQRHWHRYRSHAIMHTCRSCMQFFYMNSGKYSGFVDIYCYRKRNYVDHSIWCNDFNLLNFIRNNFMDESVRENNKKCIETYNIWILYVALSANAAEIARFCKKLLLFFWFQHFIFYSYFSFSIFVFISVISFLIYWLNWNFLILFFNHINKWPRIKRMF